MPKINPFKPQTPINPGMFAGRLTEITKLENFLFQTRSGQPTNFLILGERGIGKSSLIMYVKAIAQGVVPVDETKLNFLVVDTSLDSNTSQIGLIRKIELGLKNELAKTETTRKFFADAWNFLQRIEAGGIKINPIEKAEQEQTAFDEFCYAFVDIVNRVTTEDAAGLFSTRYDGVLILIDEADKASKTLNLGSFLKLFTETLQRRDSCKTMVGLAGLPNTRDVLRESHESSLRIFDELPLDRLDRDEINYVINKCLEKANIDNTDHPITITDDGRHYIITLSDGYPHFIQQFGYSAFETDRDNVLDTDDVINGAVAEHGALEQLGDRYYRDSFYKKIQKESYRQVLRIMAEELDDWITKQEIRAKFKGSDTPLDNALQALRKRHIILSKEGERGIYRLQHKGFALWIKFKTKDPAELQSAVEEAK